jgi:hypothetical protein
MVKLLYFAYCWYWHMYSTPSLFTYNGYTWKISILFYIVYMYWMNHMKIAWVNSSVYTSEMMQSYFHFTRILELSYHHYSLGTITSNFNPLVHMYLLDFDIFLQYGFQNNSIIGILVSGLWIPNYVKNRWIILFS